MKTGSLVLTYTELLDIPSFLDRFEYLKLGGVVGEETFGSKRHINQAFYRSREWRDFRRSIIARDNGYDLASIEKPFREKERIIIHHLNPLRVEDFLNHSKAILDPENVVCVSESTHNAIHYGDARLLEIERFTVRTPNDTCPWRW